ncbi:MAG: 16S rRNA (guanine(527)-N(7))-methyltransferase RsmG [Lautropia sp.]|nr:16S rRNA (guanine(527)-N(7))-methyltransferase RsmG [Lautropia sp.]
MNRRRAPHAAARQQAHWTATDEAHLRARLEAVGLQPTPEQLEKLFRWAALLLQWNRTYNLLGATNATTLIDEHLIDSLAILSALEKWLPERQQALVDVGTGAGFPGILIAIMQPERPIYLVEPIGKKVAFQRQSVLTLGLSNVTPLAGKIEDLDQLLRSAQRAPSARQLPAVPAAAHADTNKAHAAPASSACAVPPSTGSNGASGAVSDHDDAHANGNAEADTRAGSTSHDHHAAPDDKRFASPGTAQGNGEQQPTLHFICRAFTALDRFADLCEPFMSEQSLAFAMKAARLPEEQMALSPALRVVAVESIRTAQPEAQRYLAVMQRTAASPLSPHEPSMQISSDSTHRRRQA